MEFDHLAYKRGSIANWNRVAPLYHSGWADAGKGPFKSTRELVDASLLCKGQTVLDLACGTGAVSAEILRVLGKTCRLISLDFSSAALLVAKSSAPDANLAEMDAEFIGLKPGVFDRILCQYAVMFFPKPSNVLVELRKLMRSGGLAAFVVHGSHDNVPYFSLIMDRILKYIPDVRQSGAPTSDRFGTRDKLTNLFSSAGFLEITTKRLCYKYEVPNFQAYWQDFMSTTAASLRSKIESAGESIVSSIMREAETDCMKYEKDGQIIFPWEVILGIART